MTTLITFPTKHFAEVLTFPNMQEAERFANSIASGAVFIFAQLTLQTLRVMTLPQMVIIYNTAQLAKDRVTKLGSKKDAAQRILHLIPSIAQEATTMAAKKKAAAKTTAAKKTTSAKKTTAAKKTTGGKPGRSSGLAGKKLYRTGVREEKETGHKESRRTRSYGLIKDGMSYEKALTVGAHRDDIAKLLWRGHIEAR